MNFELLPISVWPLEEISIFSNGGHLGYRTALTDTILKGTTQGSFKEIRREVIEQSKS
jgi:hypothetical protein